MIYEKEITNCRITIKPLIYDVFDWSNLYYHYFNDPDVNKYNSHAILPCMEIKKTNDNDIVWIIFIGDRYIGNIGLHNIDLISRSAEIAILIGDKKYHGNGIGFEVMKMAMNHGFVAMNLGRIYLGTAGMNRAMVRLAGKLKMIKEGVRRMAIYSNGHYDDVIEYGILKHEFQGEDK